MNSIKFTIVCIVISMLPACSKEEKQASMKPQQMTVPVVVEKVVQKDMPVQIQAVGAVEALSSVRVKPQVDGLLLTVHFKEGQNVKKGDLLFTIDPRPFQAELAKAQANLTKNLAQAKTARELATRYENLVKKDYVTKEQYEQVRTNAESLEASVEADRAAVTNAKLQLNYCSIRSPIFGRTGNVQVHAGNVVKQNDTEMVQIHQTNPVYVTFSVPEEHLAEIRSHYAKGNLQIVVTDKSGSNPVAGSLTFINNEVNQDTGTIVLKGTFNNTQNVLWPGEFANVSLTLTTRTNAIVVPAQAVETGQDGQYVYVVKGDMTAEVRPVTVGATVAQETIIEQGVQPGETVVTDGQLRLLPGAKVEFKYREAASL
ncbi:efflux RND transporter periplasmic adaptor subunit [bacterium]|nr:efflux RND transporter periplasmic adaptor subunit [bacterium]